MKTHDFRRKKYCAKYGVNVIECFLLIIIVYDVFLITIIINIMNITMLYYYYY